MTATLAPPGERIDVGTPPVTRPRPRPGPRPQPFPHTVIAVKPAVHEAPIRPAPTPGPPRRKPQPGRARIWLAKTWQWRLFLVAITGVTLALRMFRNNKSVDLFIDESFYAEVGQSIAKGHMPNATGSNFFLHPPAFFAVEAGWMRLFGLHNEVFAQVYSLRNLVAVIGALTALVLALVVERSVGRTAAVIVTVVYVLNAFANREGSMVILEPITLFWALCGYALFARLRPRGVSGRRRQIAVAGLCFGLAALSKEFAIFVTMLPLAYAFVRNTWLTRRETLLAAVMTAVPWGIWLAIVVVTGNLHEFYIQVTAGFHRTTGTTQISGFNQKGTPSFIDAILSNLASFWTVYAILGLGTISIVYLAITNKSDQRLRFITYFGLGAVPLLAYCVLVGTNEEQFFYFLFFPALISVVAVAWRLWPRLGLKVRRIALLLLAAVLVSDGANYVVLHATVDNGTYQVDAWMAEHVADGTVVSVTNSVQREVFLRYTMINDRPNSKLRSAVRYLVVFYKQVDQGYAFVDRATIDRQVGQRTPVFETTDRSNGRMAIYAFH
jgi:4-amino-4-deoxy-L-arabinose transferase-like glycosyltransferase